jgi:hypothetical protein
MEGGALIDEKSVLLMLMLHGMAHACERGEGLAAGEWPGCAPQGSVHPRWRPR